MAYQSYGQVKALASEWPRMSCIRLKWADKPSSRIAALIGQETSVFDTAMTIGGKNPARGKAQRAGFRSLLLASLPAVPRAYMLSARSVAR